MTAKIATHAGRSMWNRQTTLDNVSIGIEVVGFHDQDITRAQYTALRQLLRQLKKIYRIKDKNILTHSMVAYGRPNIFIPENIGAEKMRNDFFIPMSENFWGSCPDQRSDVAAGRLVVADPDLHRFLYKPPKVLAALKGTKHSTGSRSMVIAQGNNAWRIARDKYDAPSTIYTYPNGKKLRGNEIRKWDSIPVGTRVSFVDEDREQEFEKFLEIGKDGNTVQDLAGNLYADPTTIYIFPDGLIRTGAEMKKSSSLRKLLKNPPKGTRLLVGYIYGGYVQKGRSATRIAGRKWNYPSTFYRMPDGRFLNGDEVEKESIPSGTLVFIMK